MSYSFPLASTPTILGVGRSNVAAGMGMAKTGHDENGHRLCCVRPAAKLTVRAKARNAFVSRRLAGSARNRPPVAASRPNHLVLRVGGLVFLASIGIRGLLKFMKMAPGTTIYVIAPREPVLDTLRRTGILKSVVVQAEYPPAG